MARSARSTEEDAFLNAIDKFRILGKGLLVDFFIGVVEDDEDLKRAKL